MNASNTKHSKAAPGQSASEVVTSSTGQRYVSRLLSDPRSPRTLTDWMIACGDRLRSHHPKPPRKSSTAFLSGHRRGCVLIEVREFLKMPAKKRNRPPFAGMIGMDLNRNADDAADAVREIIEAGDFAAVADFFAGVAHALKGRRQVKARQADSVYCALYHHHAQVKRCPTIEAIYDLIQSKLPSGAGGLDRFRRLCSRIGLHSPQ